MIENYIDLRLAVSEYVGNRGITDVFDRLVTTSEKRLNRKLRHRSMLKTAPVTFAEGKATLPDDFIEMRLFRTGEKELIQQSIEYQSEHEDYYRYYNRDRYYAIKANEIIVADLNGDHSFTYYSKIPTLTASPTATNWLLDDYPDVYEYSVGYEAARFLRDQEIRAQAAAARDMAIDELMIDSDRAEWGDAVVRLKGITP